MAYFVHNRLRMREIMLMMDICMVDIGCMRRMNFGLYDIEHFMVDTAFCRMHDRRQHLCTAIKKHARFSFLMVGLLTLTAYVERPDMY